MTQGVPVATVGDKVAPLAKFETVKGSPGEAVSVDVHFNPASLQYTITNTLEQGKGADKKKQFVSQSTAKLTMDLVFDTTHSGEDVRVSTEKMEKLLKTSGPDGKKVPPIVRFSWGLYVFTGLVEQFKETIEYFSFEGVPLRAGINLTLSSQEPVFESEKNKTPDADTNAPDSDIALAPPNPAGSSAAASALGDPRAARAIAALNGLESLRFGGGVDLAVGVGAGIELKAAAAFSVGASAGFGIGVGGGIGIGGGIGGGIGIGGGVGIGGGIGVSAGAGIGISGSAGFSAGASAGIGVSAGVGFSAGAAAGFSGLRAVSSSSGTLPSATTVLALTSSPNLGAGTQFGLGGRAQVSGSASLSADVGASGDLRGGARLSFEG